MLCNVYVGQVLVYLLNFSPVAHVQTVSYFSLVMKLVSTFGYDMMKITFYWDVKIVLLGCLWGL